MMRCSVCGGTLYIDDSEEQTMFRYGLVCDECGAVEAESEYFDILYAMREGAI